MSPSNSRGETQEIRIEKEKETKEITTESMADQLGPKLTRKPNCGNEAAAMKENEVFRVELRFSFLLSISYLPFYKLMGYSVPMDHFLEMDLDNLFSARTKGENLPRRCVAGLEIQDLFFSFFLSFSLPHFIISCSCFASCFASCLIRYARPFCMP